MNQRKIMRLASRGRRFAAYCIDAAAPLIACIILFAALAASSYAYYNGFKAYTYNDPFGMYDYGQGYGITPAATAGAVTAVFIGILILIVYTAVQLIFMSKSQSIGKAVLKLQVISSINGEPVGFWKMLLRECIVKRASASVLMLGYIWILADDKNRGWHDKILDTYVVDLKESAALGFGDFEQDNIYE